jgi:hypothetical protein
MCLMRLFFALILTGTLVGCGPQLRAVADPAVSLSGRWQLNPGEHQLMFDSLRTVLELAQSKTEQRERRRMRLPTGDAPPPDGDAAPRTSGSNWQERDRRDQLTVFLAMAVPANSMSISQPDSETVLVKPDGAAQRRLDTRDGSTLVNQFATLTVRSGWQANRFVVYSTDSSQSLELTEVYERLGNELKVTVSFKMADLKQQTLTAAYQLQP